jgi:hypothetical protein
MYMTVIDDRLLRQMHNERVRETALECQAVAEGRAVRAARSSAARPDWRDVLAGLFHRPRPVSHPRGA